MKGESKAQEIQQREQENERKHRARRSPEQVGYDKRLDGPNRPSV